MEGFVKSDLSIKEAYVNLQLFSYMQDLYYVSAWIFCDLFSEYWHIYLQVTNND